MLKWYCLGAQNINLFLSFYKSLFKIICIKSVIRKVAKIAEVITLITGLKFILQKLGTLLLITIGLSCLQRKKLTGKKLTTNQMGMLLISTN